MTSPDSIPEKRGSIAWMAGHSVAANLIMLLCLIGGFLMIRNIKQEVFPDLALDMVQISVAYPGSSPEDVERGILLAIEEAIRGLEGVAKIDSTANEGFGSVTAEFLLGSDPQQLAQDIQSEVDRITTFPEDAEEPSIRIMSHKREVLELFVSGDVGRTILHEVSEQIRDQLLQDPGITLVESTGLPALEIGVEIPQEELRRYGLKLTDVARSIRNASIDIAGGGLKTAGGEILVRMKERRDYGREFAKLPIITIEDGSEVLLGDIADIDDSFADTDRYTTYNGHSAVILEVFRVGDQTPINVSRAVYAQLDEIRANLPPGVSVGIENDRSEIYEQRINLLLKNGSIGLVLVLIILGLFLEIRLAFWVMMGIPISFVGSMLVLPFTGVTINMISLFAYIIALGIVVDDAIVVGENIYYYRQKGLSALQAAIRGAREVAMPVTFSIITNVITFMPIYFIPGFMGKIFKMIPIVVCTVFIISLFESLFVLPAHLAHSRGNQKRGFMLWLHDRQQVFATAFTRWVHEKYGPFLRLTLRNRYITIAISIAVLLVMLTYAASGRMGFQLFPKVESDYAEATVVLPYGSPVEKTQAVMDRFLEGARKVIDDSGHPELVISIVADVGRGGGHNGRMRVNLALPEIRDDIMSNDEFTRRWRETVGEVAGVEYLRFSSDSGGPGGRGRAVAVELSHRDIGVLERASADLAQQIETYPRVKDVDDGFQPGKQQLDFKIKPEGKSFGLTASDVARQIRSAFYGAEAVRQQRGRNEIRVMVRLPESERMYEENINDLLIRTASGTYVPVVEIAEIERGFSFTSISRRSGRRVIQVSADVSPRSKAGEVLADMRSEILPDLIAKYPGLTFSFEGHQADMRESMGSLKTTFILAMILVYAMLAIPFRSYAQPLIVMFSIPFGVVGAFMGHLIMGYDLCIPSMFGIVALSGVVVNDSLVMIDFANRRRKKPGTTSFVAINSAAIQRFRPIILTTLTTFGGLAPMILETSRQARFLIPMALSLGFGILFATVITLIIVPSLYLVIEDGVRVFSRKKIGTVTGEMDQIVSSTSI